VNHEQRPYAGSVLAIAEGLLADALPGEADDPENWPNFAILVPHIASLIRNRGMLAEDAPRPEPRYQRAVHESLKYLYVRDISSDSLKLTNIVVTNWTVALGPADMATLQAKNQVGNMLTNQAKHREALEIFEELIGVGAERFVHDRAFSLTVMNNLGVAHLNLDQFEKAEKILRRAFQECAALFGESHPKTLRLADNLGSALTGLGNHQEAFDLLTATLVARTAVRGELHQDTLFTACHLGEALIGLRRHGEAQAILDQTLRSQRDLLGDEHFDTKRTLKFLEKLRKGDA